MNKKISNFKCLLQTHHVYSLVVAMKDLSGESFIKYIIDKTKYYLIAREKSESKRLHYQCWIMLEQPLTENQRNTMRNYIKRKFSDTSKRAPVSLKASYKPKNLLKYCQKDENFVTNLNPLTLIAIGKWIKDHREKKTKKIEQLIQLMREKISEEGILFRCTGYCLDGLWGCMPTKRQYWYAKLQSNRITPIEYAQEFYFSNKY